MSKRNGNFKLDQCNYEVQAYKKNCSRSVFFTKFGFPYSYTIESSFGIYNDKHITSSDVTKIGEDLCLTVV
jgi:hypothetical protein